MQVILDISKHQMDILAGLFKEMKIHYEISEESYEEKVERNLVKIIKESKEDKMIGVNNSKHLIDKYLQNS